LITTLGFDEKFTIRFLMRHSEGSRVLYVITAEPMEERAEKALRNVEDFVRRYLEGVELITKSVNPANPPEAIKAFKEIFTKHPGELFAINVSGGMRALILELVTAAVISRVNGHLEIELENFRGVVRIPLAAFTTPPPGSEEVKILKALAKVGGMAARELSKELGIPRSTLYKYLGNLLNNKLVKSVKYEGRVYYEITELGLMFI